MANWNNPTLASTYSDVIADFKARDVDAITLQYSAPSNLPTGAIKYERTLNKFQEWSGSAFVDKVLSLEGGGTGATTAAGVRTALALGTLALQNSNAVTITGGSISGLSSLGLSGNLTSTGNGSFSGTLSAAAGGSVPIKSEAATIAGQWTFTSIPIIAANAAGIQLQETDAGVDAKNWRIVADGSVLNIATLTDALALTNRFTFSRAGLFTASNGITVTAGLGQFGGGMRATGAASFGAGGFPGTLSFETPYTRLYLGDTTGYSFAFAKRGSSVTTDLVTINEIGTTLVVGGTFQVNSTTALVGNVSMNGTLLTSGAVTFSTTLAVTGISTFSDQIKVVGGSAAAPGIQLGSDADTGIWATDTRLQLGVDLNGLNPTHLEFYDSSSNYAISFVSGGTTVLQYDSVNKWRFFEAAKIYGNFTPATDNTYTCGASGSRWSAVWAANGTIQTSDERQKAIKGNCRGLDFIRTLNPFEYDWINSPEGKIHMGVGARAIRAAYPELALVQGRESDVMGLNYSELIAPIIQSIKELYDLVQARS